MQRRRESRGAVSDSRSHDLSSRRTAATSTSRARRVGAPPSGSRSLPPRPDRPGKEGDTMPSTSRLLAVAVAVLLAGVAVYGSLKSSAATGPEFIRITDRQFGYTRVDAGSPGQSVGDQ